MDVAGVEVEKVKGGIIAETRLKPEVKKDERKSKSGIMKQVYY